MPLKAGPTEDTCKSHRNKKRRTKIEPTPFISITSVQHINLSSCNHFTNSNIALDWKSRFSSQMFEETKRRKRKNIRT